MKRFLSIITLLTVALAAVQLTSCNNDPDVNEVKILANDTRVNGLGGKLNIPYSITGVKGVMPTVECSDSWVRNISVNDSFIICDVEANPTKEERSTEITIYYERYCNTTITLTQGVADSDFVINATPKGAYSCVVNFVPMNYEGPFFFLVVDKSYFDLYYLGDDIESLYQEDLDWLMGLAEGYDMSLEEYLGLNKQLFSADGSQVDMSYSDLEPKTSYVAYCYGMELDGTRKTDICFVEFSTEIIATSDIEFELNVKDITANSANITITPSNSDYYYWTYISEMDYALYDDYAVMVNMISNIAAEVANGAALSDILHSGASSQTPTKLWSGTKYHIIAWGMDMRCNATTQPVNIGSFTTEAGGVVDNCTFDISCPEVKQTDMLINVKPSNNDTRYMICPVEESICGAYGDEQMAQRLINMEQARFNEGFYGAGVNWSNAEWIFTGEQSVWGRADLDWTFEAGKTYRIYVFGVDQNGVRTTNIARFDQKAADVVASDMTFQVELVKNVWDHPIIRITPSNDTEYWVACVMKTEYVDWYRNADGSINDHDMMHMLDEEYFDGQAKYYAKQGTQENSYYWSSDSEYSLVVCGWSGTNTTPFYEFKFNTPSIPWNESQAAVELKYYLFNGAELADMAPMMWAGYEDNCIIYIEYTPNEYAAHWYGGVWLPLEYYELGVDHLIPLLKNDTVSHVDQSWGRYSGCVFNTPYSLSWFAEDAEGKFGEWNYIEFTPNRTEGEGYNMSEPFDFWTNPKRNSAVVVM